MAATAEKNEIDLGDLVKLARDKSSAGRIAMAATLAELFNNTGSALKESERTLMFDVMRELVHEAEVCVRRTLAAYLAASDGAPRDLMTMLANDDIDVAFPVLTESGVLKDLDLIEVVRSRTFQHQLAVAVREDLSAEVTDALVETGNTDVIRAALDNESARFSTKSMERVVDMTEEKGEPLQRSVLYRDDLSPELAKRMLMWVSVALRYHIVEKFNIDAVELDGMLEHAALDVLEEFGREAETGVDASNNADIATPGLMVEALQDGNIADFIGLFHKASGLRRNLVMRLMMEPGGEGLAVACKGMGFSRSFYSTLFTLAQKAVPGIKKAGKMLDGAVAQSLVFFDSIEEKQCQKLLGRWQLDSGYLNALRHFESISG